MGRKAALPGSGNSETKASKSENGENIAFPSPNIAFSEGKHTLFRGKTCNLHFAPLKHASPAEKSKAKPLF